jgi:hypothetical protein
MICMLVGELIKNILLGSQRDNPTNVAGENYEAQVAGENHEARLVYIMYLMRSCNVAPK